MPRSPRFLLSRSFYHVITRGNNQHCVFKKPEDYQYYLDLIKRFKSELPFDLYHYCLMPNHVHLLVRTKKSSDFSLFMKKLNLAYFCYYKEKYGWSGHFWQDRFRSQPVGKDKYFLQCGKYIELNPVRANLKKGSEEYLYSSYRFYAAGQGDDLITEDFFYNELAKNPQQRQEKYRELMIGEVVGKNYNRKIWGSKSQTLNELEKIRYHTRIAADRK